MKFYVGIHQPRQAQYVEHAFISVNRVRSRKRPVPSSDWILDSGAFRELEQFGSYRHDVREYAETVNRLAAVNAGLTAAVAQDWMCEPFMLQKTGRTIIEHQQFTIQRYDALHPLIRGVHLMPVLQGYALDDYLLHLQQYGCRLTNGMYVGIGSLCKRNSRIGAIETILIAIKRQRPDLRLHGFGIKTTSLASGVVRECLFSADSMSWSWAARRQGRDANNHQEAVRFAQRIDTMPVQFGWKW